MSGSLIGVAVIAAMALVALGAIGVTGVSTMGRGPEDTGNVYGTMGMSMTAVFVLTLVAFVVAWLVK